MKPLRLYEAAKRNIWAQKEVHSAREPGSKGACGTPTLQGPQISELGLWKLHIPDASLTPTL